MSHFIKTQYKAKAEALAVLMRLDEDHTPAINQLHAKAGQSLVTPHETNLIDLGPVVRYMRTTLARTLPDNVYTHGGKTTQDMDDWCRTHATTSKTFTCDFTAYDQSCTSEVLGFELAFMDYCGIPQELMALYEDIKVDMFTEFGHSAVMRFTGEFGTFDFNTFWNMAYMELRYRPDPKVARAFAGDDSLFFGELQIDSAWYNIQHLFTLVGKTHYSSWPEFCGWLLYPFGCVRSPLILALKLIQKEALDQLPQVLDSYFLEFLWSIRAGDELFHLPPVQLEALSFVQSFFRTHSPNMHFGPVVAIHHLVSIPGHLLTSIGKRYSFFKNLAHLALATPYSSSESSEHTTELALEHHYQLMS